MEEFAIPQHYNGDEYVNADKALKAMFHNAAPDAVSSPLLMFWWGSAFKYLWRWSRKGGLDDLDKAIDCIRRMQAEVEN